MPLWSVAKHYGCKRARHCGLIANGRSQANRDFSCVRNTNCCFARCAESKLLSSNFMSLTTTLLCAREIGWRGHFRKIRKPETVLWRICGIHVSESFPSRFGFVKILSWIKTYTILKVQTIWTYNHLRIYLSRQGFLINYLGLCVSRVGFWTNGVITLAFLRGYGLVCHWMVENH